MRLPFAGLAAFLLCGPAAAQQTCGERTVAQGDTLTAIAQDAYGRPEASAEIFAANRDRLSEPGLIRPGQTLRLPCAEGLPAGDTAASADPAAPEAAAPAPAPVVEAPDLPLRAAIGGAHTNLPAAFRAASRAREALALAVPDRTLRTAPGGWEALAALHPDGDAVLAFPWIVPDCAAVHLLPAPEAALCTRYDRSPPLASIPVVWVARRGSDAARAKTPAALRGLAICRRAGAPDADLAAAGLAPPRAIRLAPPAAADCVQRVAEGQAAAASLLGPEIPPLPPELMRVPALAGALAFHALARKDSAEGRAALAALNRGLASLDAE